MTHELTFKKLSTSIYAFCASKTTEDKYSKELSFESIKGFSPRIKTMDQAYSMMLEMMEPKNGFSLNFLSSDPFPKSFHTPRESCETTPVQSDDEEEEEEEEEEKKEVTNLQDKKITCMFSHDLYGIEISFELDRIQDGIIIYDVKSEKRLRQLEKQLKGVFFLEKCSKPIRFSMEKLELRFNSISYEEYSCELKRKISNNNTTTTYDVINIFCSAMTILKSLEEENDHVMIFKGHDLSPLTLLTKIKRLKIIENTVLTNITDIQELTTLEELSLENCSNIIDISAISKLKNLKKLNLSGCLKVVDIRPLSKMANLEELNIENTNVKNTLCLKQLPNLEIV